MATSQSRAWRAACPNCGAPVEFASAASASAVCSFCRSTLLRDGEALKRIGVSAELFDDHSPLRLGASGVLQGRSFTLVGRLQYGYDGGTWNEWHAFFDNGRSAWLSEDNGAYVLAVESRAPADAPQLDELRAGQRVLADRRAWDVASVVRARLIAAEGELPTPPRLQGEFLVADLRNSQGEVATLDGSELDRGGAVHWSVGRSVLLADLRMQGLAETSEKTLQGRAIECPSCGAALEPKLGTTKSLACGQCKAVVDISAGAGAELAFFAQNNSGPGGLEPQIPLGKTGQIALATTPGAERAAWQVVGYLERCDIPDDADEDQTFWREYLLWNRTLGFAFLVDAEDGWSWVRPITGAPQASGDIASYEDVTYRRQYTYTAKVTWVLGEFYWRVQRDERALVSDYVGTGAHGTRRLAREQTGNEVTWSAGATLTAAAVAEAFGIAPGARAALEREVKPLSQTKGTKTSTIVIIVLIFIVLAILDSCDDDDCDSVRAAFGASSNEYQQCLAQRGSGGGSRTGGGSFGGWSGGGHK